MRFEYEREAVLQREQRRAAIEREKELLREKQRLAVHELQRLKRERDYEEKQDDIREAQRLRREQEMAVRIQCMYRTWDARQQYRLMRLQRGIQDQVCEGAVREKGMLFVLKKGDASDLAKRGCHHPQVKRSHSVAGLRRKVALHALVAWDLAPCDTLLHGDAHFQSSPNSSSGVTYAGSQ